MTTTQRSTDALTELDREIALTARPGEEGAFDGRLSADWLIGAGVNGGLLLAACGHALSRVFEADGHPDPFSISAYYLAASRPGPTTLRTEVLRRGRTMSTGAVSLSQGSPGTEHGTPVERIRALATYGDLGALPDDVRTTAAAPVLPPVEDCVPTSMAPAQLRESASLLDRLDLRLDPSCVGWAVGEPSGRGFLQGWLRLADGRQPDPLMLLLAVDALPPVTFDLGLPGWAPTLELTAHVRAVPEPGWLKVVHRTRNFAGGLLEEDAEVWDEAGRLVAQSRQLARAPRETGRVS